ncbi:hypothetical protein SAMN06295933_1123 [Desulfovibrio gilichinskyi]|uniref:Uncharacterized protein n=1 Tax=Desulfovibrio gilichinskyi TaxID=1519643 RepID=A0A1X7CRY1_9BACT|nr:hypothetical protein SAMN06295933_1123 [Desulfovibrio gilichinskyi]
MVLVFLFLSGNRSKQLMGGFRRVDFWVVGGYMPVGSQNIFAVSDLASFKSRQQNEIQNSFMAVFIFYFLFVFLFFSILPFFAFLKNICRSFSPSTALFKRSFLHIKSSFQHIHSRKPFHLIPSHNNPIFPDRLSPSNYEIFPYRELFILNRVYYSLSGNNLPFFQSI